MRIDSHHSFTERYPLAHLGTILKRNRFEGSILVAPSFLPPVSEDFVRGIVFPFDASRLDEYQRHPQFRGVWIGSAVANPDGVAELERRAIPLDVTAGAAGVAELAEHFPALRIAIGNPGGPAAGLERAAQFSNVCCKLSGLTRLEPSPRDYVRHAMALFGPDRLMFGSGWPDCLPEATWKACLAAFTQSIGAQPIEIREQLLGATAERFYAL